MLSLHHNPERYAVTHNMWPTHRGMRSRPGATQLIAGAIIEARGWGERIVFEAGGRIQLWDGALHDICAAGTTLQVSNFQVLTKLGRREDRLYVADGAHPLWYLARRDGAYIRVTVSNSVVDNQGRPYPLPIPTTIATWRNRLWLGWDTNRVRHCEHERPDAWDPLFELEFQDQESDTVIALKAHGERLAVGLSEGLWSVAGDSQFNFRREPLNLASGVAGPQALVSDGAGFLGFAGRGGLYAPNLVSDDIEEAFGPRPFGSQLLLDADRQLLWCLLGGRLFLTWLPAPGRFGEIVSDLPLRGLYQTDSLIGWYGDDGLWALSADGLPDRWLAGASAPVESRISTWWAQPNRQGSARALCNRTRVTVLNARGELTYTARADGYAVQLVAALASATDTPVQHEFAPRLAGRFFEHELRAQGYLQVLDFAPAYRFEAVA